MSRKIFGQRECDVVAAFELYGVELERPDYTDARTRENPDTLLWDFEKCQDVIERGVFDGILDRP